jgi:VCBS repeat-containing protein
MSISNFEDKQYTEQQGTIQLSTAGSFANGVNYGTGFVQFAVSQGGDSGDFLSLTSAANPNAAGAISISGSTVFLGNGSSHIQIGTVDSISNGQAGKALKINFDNVTVAGTSPVTNGDFSNGLTGWTSVLTPIDLGNTKIAGWATPESPLIKYPSQTPGGDDNDLAGGFDAPQVFVNGAGQLQLQETNMTSSSFGVVHGPAAYSDVFHATGGMVLKFDWTANLVNDDYHVVGYLLNSDTGAVSIALQGWGATGSGVGSVAVPTDGNYRFVFVSGSFDATGGTVLGASMFIDNIRVEAGAVTDAVVQALSHQVVYQNTSDAPAASKTVTVSAKDISGAVASDDLLINVTQVNDAPVMVTQMNLPGDPEDVTYTIGSAALLAGISDPDHDVMSVTGVTASVGTVVANADGSFTVLQAPNFNGTVTLSYTVIDGHGGALPVSRSYVIAPVNDAPVAAADTAATDQNTKITIDVMANDQDVDVGDSMTLVSVVGAPFGGSVAIVNGKLSYDPSGHFQSLGAGVTTNDSFNYTIKDSAGATSTGIVQVTVTGVNDAPVAQADAVFTGQNSIVTIDVLANDTDVDRGDSKTLVSVDGSHTVGSVSIVNGKVSYDPGAHFNALAAGQTAIDTFTYTMQDSGGAQSTATVSVQIVGQNDAPVANADSGNAVEDGGAVTVDVLANDTDIDNGDTRTLVSVDTTGTTGAASIVGGKVSYDAGAQFQSLGAGATATDTFSYTMKDSGGIARSATVTMTVTGVNDAPVANADKAATSQNSALVVDVLANDTDVDAGDTQTLVSVDSTGTVGAVSLAGGKVSYDPGSHFQSLGAGASATDSFSYTMKDSGGIERTATVTVTINGVNDAPVANADSGAAVEDGGAIVIAVLANDTDIDTGDTQSLVSLNTAGTVGAASIVDGKVSYDPGAHFQSLGAGATATDSFTYTMKDSGGIERTATVTVTVTGVNDAPVAFADSGKAVEDGGVVIVDVLANDTDVDAGDTKALVSLDSTGTVGSVSIVNGKVAYDPGANFQSLGVGATATDTFSYTMKDSAGVQQTAKVTMTIVGTNDAPVAHADTATAQEKQAITVDVLANDTDIDAGDVKTIASVDSSSALGGSLAIVNGKIQYTANADSFDLLTNGQSVTDSFSYTVKDASGATSSATVSVKVVGVADGANIMGTVKSDTGSTALVGTALDEAIYGNNGDDQLFGNGGSDHLFGENGEDTLNGGDGIDFLDGGNGKDVLIGGKGSDLLTGGEGNDVFVFGKEGTSKDVDVITDFKVGNDTIQLLDGLSITSLVKVDYNHDGVMDTELVLSNGSHVELLGVSSVSNPAPLM